MAAARFKHPHSVVGAVSDNGVGQAQGFPARVSHVCGSCHCYPESGPSQWSIVAEPPSNTCIPYQLPADGVTPPIVMAVRVVPSRLSVKKMVLLAPFDIRCQSRDPVIRRLGAKLHYRAGVQ